MRLFESDPKEACGLASGRMWVAADEEEDTDAEPNAVPPSLEWLDELWKVPREIDMTDSYKLLRR